MANALAITSRDLDSATALTILTKGPDYLKEMSDLDRLLLTEGEDDREAFSFKPTRIRISAGGAKSFQTKDGELIQAPLTGYIIFGTKTRGYWPEKDGNIIPFCSSVGNVHGRVNPQYSMEDLRHAAGARNQPHPAIIDLDEGNELRTAYSCVGCPMDAFGSEHQSGTDSNGKACKEKVELFFLPKGWYQPVILSIPTMSVGSWNSYCSSLRASTGKPYYAFETKLDVEIKANSKGIKYGQVQFLRGEPLADIDIVRSVLALQAEAKAFLNVYGLDVELEGVAPTIHGADDDDVIDAER